MSSSKDLVLKMGTNELEIVEFKIGNNHFGISVAKIMDIIKYRYITRMPNVHPYVQGVFKPKDRVITVVDLPKYLNLDTEQSVEKDHFLISHINKSTVAFRVNAVVGIRRLSLEEMEKVNDDVCEQAKGTVIGSVKSLDSSISVIDFDKMLTDISLKTGNQISDIKPVELDKKMINRF